MKTVDTRFAWGGLSAAVCAAACHGAPSTAPAPSSSPPAPSDSAPLWEAGPRPPAPPEGMVWVPPGALVAGTPAGLLPRIPDQEMPGEQVILKGFFISIYAYPNEEGAIPLANVTQAEAEKLCEERGQRLCTELEWERACKGPDNHVYEYGDRYRPDVCGTGTEPRMLPSGLRVACRSDFGVRDLHGSIAEWTANAWGRGSHENLVAVRGGNGANGELFGRCANALAKPPDTKSPQIGFRCCQGPANEAEVALHVERKKPLEEKLRLDETLRTKLREALPAEARAELRHPDTFKVARAWLWHPVGNEELLIAGGCTGELVKRGCGVMAVRLSLDEPVVLAWAGSGAFVPTLETDYDPRFVWVYGGDERSHYRRLLSYAWGRVALGEIQRNAKLVKQARR